MVTLTAIHRLIYEEFAANKALVIAPKRVAQDTWSRECEKWEHLHDLRISLVLGTQKQRMDALAADADVYVINRENVVWLLEDSGYPFDYDIVVIDELSSFKSNKAKRWKALRKFIGTAPYVWGLTGTPAANGYLDLWPEVYLLDQGARLGRTLGKYRTTYFTPGAHRGHVVFDWRLKPGAKNQIDGRLSDLCLTMSKEDWLTMPGITYNVIPVTMGTKERKLYERMKRDHILTTLEEHKDEDKDMGAIVAETAATLSGKLLQMANGAVYDENRDVVHIHDKKLEAMDELLESANGNPVLCFYSYKHDLVRLRERFPNGVGIDEPGAIRRWNDGEVPLLFAHPASAGHGLNLQDGGHIIVWFGLPWSLELYQQANNRLYRMGQEHPVVIHHIVAEHTLDEKVMSALTDKAATQKSLLDALKDFVVTETEGDNGKNHQQRRPDSTLSGKSASRKAEEDRV